MWWNGPTQFSDHAGGKKHQRNMRETKPNNQGGQAGGGGKPEEVDKPEEDRRCKTIIDYGLDRWYAEGLCIWSWDHKKCWWWVWNSEKKFWCIKKGDCWWVWVTNEWKRCQSRPEDV